MKHISPYCPFDEKNFLKFFEHEFKIQLNGVEFPEAKLIYDALHMLPKRLVKGVINTIAFDPSLGPADKFYPNHGRWEQGTAVKKGTSHIEQDQDGNINATMYLNRDVFKKEPNEVAHLILHETGHAVDHSFGEISKTKAWQKLSGWTTDPPGITLTQRSDPNYTKHEGLERLKIQEGFLMTESDWWFNSKASFVRWYAKRSPAEDFAESFAFCVLGEMERFKGCENKAKYIKTHVLKNK